MLLGFFSEIGENVMGTGIYTLESDKDRDKTALSILEKLHVPDG